MEYILSAGIMGIAIGYFIGYYHGEYVTEQAMLKAFKNHIEKHKRI